MNKVGIFGGTFNPVHLGHIILARYIRKVADLDEVWLSVSPLSPFKQECELVDDNHRLVMLNEAVKGYDGLRAISRELMLPRPSYTLTLLDTLAAEHPDCKFRLIIGGDNWEAFEKWHRWNEILDRYRVIVYPRPDCRLPSIESKNVEFVEAPLMDISSTAVREAIKSCSEDVNQMLSPAVYNYIKDNHLYE